MPKIETTSKVSVKLTSRKNLGICGMHTTAPILCIAHKPPKGPERAKKPRYLLKRTQHKGADTPPPHTNKEVHPPENKHPEATTSGAPHKSAPKIF